MSTIAKQPEEANPAPVPSSDGIRGKLLFAIEGIDLGACVADADAIARINPHRNELALLDRVIWHNKKYTRGVGVKVTRSDEFWVRGHFPGKPMYPGVLMIESAAQLACYLYNIRQPQPTLAAFMRIDDAVFRRSVGPGEHLYIICEEIKYSPRRFVSAAQGIVDGQIAFEAKITGVSLGAAELPER